MSDLSEVTSEDLIYTKLREQQTGRDYSQYTATVQQELLSPEWAAYSAHRIGKKGDREQPLALLSPFS